jgi:hypothetical protein
MSVTQEGGMAGGNIAERAGMGMWSFGLHSLGFSYTLVVDMLGTLCLWSSGSYTYDICCSRIRHDEILE